MGAYRCSIRRKGAVMVLVAILLVAVIAFLALAVDVGYLYVVKQDLQTAADAGALAGASGLSVSQEEARARAVAYAQKNPTLAAAVTIQPSDVELIPWPPDSPPETPPTAVRVTAQFRADRGNAVGLYLARVLGVASSDVVASAIASFGARDIVVVLDYSASMSYDSQTRHISQIGRAEVEQSLLTIWQSLGSPTYGNMQFTPVHIGPTNPATIMDTLGLNGVPYPYPPRTWSDYFSYVQGTPSAHNENKTVLDDPHYRKQYGYLTLMDYWQAVQYRATPDAVALWQTPQQPITAVKDAVDLFLYYMEHPRTDDRVALAAFTYTDGTATLEVPLTANYSQIESTSRHRQAGHYHNQTNIAAGIEVALEELRTRGRPGAQRLIVLLSDGHANWIDNNHPADEPAAKEAALRQAPLAAHDKVQIIAISLGADADVDLMRQLAESTGGVLFTIPGGHAVSEYRDQLLAAFAQIALQRPLKLVY